MRELADALRNKWKSAVVILTGIDDGAVSIVAAVTKDLTGKLQAGKQVHTIANLNQPQQTYFDAPTNHLFVSSSGDGTVKVFDGSTFQLLQTTQLSTDADNMRFDARNKHLIVAYGGEKFLNGQVARQGVRAPAGDLGTTEASARCL